MKAVTIAAAGAALIGTVAAGSHVENMHKQLHARSGWSDWSSDPVAESTTKPKDTTNPVKITSTKPAAETTSSEESTWEDWTSTTSSDPVKITSTKPAGETTDYSVTWEDWSSTTSSDPVKITSTSSYSWEDWSSTSSDPVKITSTSSDPVESHTWADWESSSSPVEITSTTYDPTHTWADWESSSSPVKITSTSYDPSHTWADWESSTVVKSGTTTTTIYLGKPTDPSSVPADLASTAATITWEDWSTTPAVETSPAVKTSVSTSSPVAPVWSSNGWFGPGWGADGQCAIQVVTSYGSPICKFVTAFASTDLTFSRGCHS
jgi:hypothetical protein